MVKKTDGPFGKPGVEEKFSLVGAAPGISAEGEAIVEFDDNWVVLTKRGRGQAATVRQRSGNYASRHAKSYDSRHPHKAYSSWHHRNLGTASPCHSY